MLLELNSFMVYIRCLQMLSTVKALDRYRSSQCITCTLMEYSLVVLFISNSTYRIYLNDSIILNLF